jgi:hypothetical protein
MGQFDKFTREQCVARINACRDHIRVLIFRHPAVPLVTRMAGELDYRNELIELRQRLLAIEVIERDALSIELQTKQQELEDARATTHES